MSSSKLLLILCVSDSLISRSARGEFNSRERERERESLARVTVEKTAKSNCIWMSNYRLSSLPLVPCSRVRSLKRTASRLGERGHRTPQQVDHQDTDPPSGPKCCRWTATFPGGTPRRPAAVYLTLLPPVWCGECRRRLGWSVSVRRWTEIKSVATNVESFAII